MLNLLVFPEPPAEVGPVDVGPLVGLWYLAVHTRAHEEAGLRLVRMWRDVEDRDDVFFLFEVADADRARAFVNAPESARTGQAAGVIDGEVRFVDDVPVG